MIAQDQITQHDDSGGNGDDDNDAYIASLLHELNETRRQLEEKASLLQRVQEDYDEKKTNSDDDDAAEVERGLSPSQAKQNDDDDDTIHTHHHQMHGIDRELANSIGPDSIATYEDIVTAQKNLRLKNRSITSNVISSLSATHRSQEEIDAIVNIARRSNSSEWDAICKDLNIMGDGPAINDNKIMTPFYAPPLQRQRYGDTNILPHVGWGDLFFDLFYVGAAFNLGELLKSCIGKHYQLRSYLFFFGSLGPLWAAWETETFYQSRFLTIDYTHRVAEVCRYVFVAVAISNITPILSFDDPLSANVLIYTLSMMLEQFMQLVLRIELYFKGLGDEVPIKNQALHQIKYRKLPFLILYIIAFSTALVMFIKAKKENAEGKEIKRGAIWDLNDLPMTITSFIYLLELLYESTWLFFRKNEDARTCYVPVNVDFLIERYGEFVLLMLGESILSLIGLGETAISRFYYEMVILGVVLVICLHFLKFESEPTNALAHALWGNRWNTVSFLLLIQIISVSLIGLGTSFKVFLHEIIKESTDGGEYDANHQGANTLFVIFLTLTLISLELLNLCHIGIKGAIGHLFTKKGQKTRLYWPVVFITLIKLILFFFTVTLNQWIEEPEHLVTAGCAVVIGLSATRVLIYFSIHQKALLDTSIRNAKQSVVNVKSTILRATTKKCVQGP